MPGSREFWTEARVALLRRLRDDGVPYEAIAAQLGVTRSAISGKVDRLGLAVRERKPRAPRKLRAALKRRMVKGPASVTPILTCPADAGVHPGDSKDAGPSSSPSPSVPPPSARGSRACSLLGLTEHTCRWPVGDPGDEDFFFCGEAPAGEGPYCATHRRIAYRPFDTKPESDFVRALRPTPDFREQPDNRFGQFAEWDVT